MDKLIIPDGAGLETLRTLLGQAENQLTEWRPRLIEYRQARSNAKAEYDYELACAKIVHQNEKSPTMTNAHAAKDTRSFQLSLKSADANLILAEETVSGLQDVRDTLKCMVKSEQQSY